MPVHDWTRVDAGIFHAFHHDWIIEIARALNAGVLPPDHYALPEQHAAGFGPDVLTLETTGRNDESEAVAAGSTRSEGGALLLCEPKLAPTAETDMEFYRRKQNVVAIHHVTGDRIVAMVEIVSPGNKATRHAMRSFIEKAAQMLERGVHLLIVDLFPPGPRDPNGIHATIWEDVAGQQHVHPPGKPLSVVAYETLSIRAYVQPLAVGDSLRNMPLFLKYNACVEAPLEITYQAAFAGMARRWRDFLQGQG